MAKKHKAQNSLKKGHLLRILFGMGDLWSVCARVSSLEIVKWDIIHLFIVYFKFNLISSFYFKTYPILASVLKIILQRSFVTSIMYFFHHKCSPQKANLCGRKYMVTRFTWGLNFFFVICSFDSTRVGYVNKWGCSKYPLLQGLYVLEKSVNFRIQSPGLENSWESCILRNALVNWKKPYCELCCACSMHKQFE